MGLFKGGLTPVANPGSAVLTESKRLPLLWSPLGVAVPHWRSLLPLTVDPWGAPLDHQGDWVLKAAYGNTGDAVYSVGWNSPARQWQSVVDSRLRPHRWIAQRRFKTTVLSTPLGPMYPCLGVYTVNGKASGFYGRLSPRPVIDGQAVEVPILIPR